MEREGLAEDFLKRDGQLLLERAEEFLEELLAEGLERGGDLWVELDAGLDRGEFGLVARLLLVQSTLNATEFAQTLSKFHGSWRRSLRGHALAPEAWAKLESMALRRVSMSSRRAW